MSKRPKVPYWVSRDKGKQKPKGRQPSHGHRQNFSAYGNGMRSFGMERSLPTHTSWNLSPNTPLITQFVSKFDPLKKPRLFVVGSCRDTVSELAEAARHAYLLIVITDTPTCVWLREHLAVVLPERHQYERIDLIEDRVIQLTKPPAHTVDGILCLFETPFRTFEETSTLLGTAYRLLRQNPSSMLVIRATLPTVPGFFPVQSTPISDDGKMMSDLRRSAGEHGLFVSMEALYPGKNFTLVITRPQRHGN